MSGAQGYEAALVMLRAAGRIAYGSTHEDAVTVDVLPLDDETLTEALAHATRYLHEAAAAMADMSRAMRARNRR